MGVSVAQKWRAPRTYSVTNADTATPKVLGTSNDTFLSITFLGMKAARTNNAGVVWIQMSSSDGAVGYPIQPGQALNVELQDGLYLPLSDFYVDVETAGDGVQIICW